MSGFKELLKRHAGHGTVTWIGVRSKRLAPVDICDAVEIDALGLKGDHAHAAARAVTILQAEHLAVIASLAHQPTVSPEALRRNIVVAGINLSALRQQRVRFGGVILQLEKPCAPCSRMERAIGPGGYNAMRGHGGWYASVVEGGVLRLGDRVGPDLSDTAQS